jgi:hypothetical protein
MYYQAGLTRSQVAQKMVSDNIATSVEDAVKLLDRGPDGFVPKEEPKKIETPAKPVETSSEAKPEEVKKGERKG